MNKERIGYFNIEVSDNGREIKVYRRRMKGKELLFDFAISDASQESAE